MLDYPNLRLRTIPAESKQLIQTRSYRIYQQEMPLYHCCVVSGSLVDTPAGRQAVDGLRPGDKVWGVYQDLKIVTTIEKVYYAPQMPDTIEAYMLDETVVLAETAYILWEKHWVPLAKTDLPHQLLSKPVFDLKTACGNFLCHGVLVGHPE